MISYLKDFVPSFIRKPIRNLNLLKPFSPRTCPICSYNGFFEPAGRPPRIDAACTSCNSLERHRHLYLNLDVIHQNFSSSPRILHFAAEECLQLVFKKHTKFYFTADIRPGFDLQLNIESFEVTEPFDIIYALEVLEHVDDQKALVCINRALSESGLFVCTVPIVPTWTDTYSNPDFFSEQSNWLYHGQGDHLRIYGSNFVDYICSFGFAIEHIFIAKPEDSVEYSLIRGEQIFVFKKIV